ncbi:MAG: hypothetical protein MUO42_12010 [Anaerolineaceae bacterium]|nr:hypothetical protein [Anaerolineaceae bacterium]
MTDFQIWLFASIILNCAGCIVTYVKNTFSVEIINFIVFVAAIGYIILNRYNEGYWGIIPLIWLAGMILAAILLLIAQNRHQQIVVKK